jgi:hypothetical protein
LENGFREFLSNIEGNEGKAEYLIPTLMDKLIKEEVAQITLLETHDKWFGVTYLEDKEHVTASLRALIDAGVYPECLYPNLYSKK